MPVDFPGTRRKKRRARLRALAVMLVLTAGVVTFALSRGNDRRGLAAFDGEDPGAIHVHGLGVAPGDDSLYAATHSGVFRIDQAGDATRIANRYQDTMGFTVLGREHFLASGHPDMREKLPPRLGLIESRDGGQSWTSRSLSGQADLHDIASSQGTVYAVDSSSGALMVTRDMKRWDTRPQPDVQDVAVSPEDANRVVALTSRGTLRSGDGARTFSAVSPAPPIILVGWGGAGLFGATAQGDLWSSADGGATWVERGSAPGEPVSILVSEREVIVALADARIISSNDGGATWRDRYKPSAR